MLLHNRNTGCELVGSPSGTSLLLMQDKWSLLCSISVPYPYFLFLNDCNCFYGFTTKFGYVHRMLDRIQTTWRGSMDDVGWLQRMPGSAGVQDRTPRFGQILGSVW